ncbi:hypothetical protein [Methanocella arvoryzae]|uniref:Uncharacterized protein n=1 Tax=Methanocella arvoryzae (strain DSM 22066 / NBRC 105507 / MRE50) TaxID=351160 RepID=Q0W2Q6_METAR|nr:hypothetical protein [Methanocella arvoryzae]CAJ37337.1 hypothetical protein RCIX2218 [Methanocella arvoryzae MRE50]
MKRMERKGKPVIYLVLLTAIVAVAVASSGCTGDRDDTTTLYGKDIFDPAKFSMARYDVTANESGTVSHRDLVIITARNEKDGDRITTQEIYGNNSVRTNVWVNKDRTAATNVLITAINSSTLIITGGYPPFNMTTADKAWNSLDATYALIGTATVNTSAGMFDNCSVYGAGRMIGYGDGLINMSVYYYMHPSMPVPVLYVVQMPDAVYEYNLISAYGPNDRDSTPERVIQAFFDSLEQGDNATASSYVVTYDGTDSKFKPLSGSAYKEFLQGTGAMYGNAESATKVQYVLTTRTGEEQQIGGREVVAARWTSVQYQPAPLSVFELNGKLNVVNIGGHWKIVG